jgi:hypothetical protein
VNQLSRGRELDIQRLVKAGEALEQAQRDAIAGDSAGFDSARRDENDAVRRLREAAEQVLPSASTAMLDRVAKTLTAAAATQEGRALIKQGRLTEDLEPPGFEALAGLAPARGKAARKRAQPDAAPTRKRAQQQIQALRKRKREADEKAKEAAGEARELERSAREADQAARKAHRAAETARKRADAAAAEAKNAEEELSELQKR